jgi:hypothetical protein
MVETCSVTIMISMKHSSYKKREIAIEKKKKRDTMKRGKREKSTIFPW